MRNVDHILRDKGTPYWSVTPDTMVYEALGLMADKDVGALLVLDATRLVGIISERDYARKVILRGKSSLGTPVREIMTANVVTVSPQHTVEECMALMTARRVRHLPVLVADEVAGIVSIGDLVKASLDDKDFMIKQLETYIMGDRQ
jgi:CBS domain-containing protein